MRALLACAFVALPTILLAGTPELLWTFQGIEDVNAFAALPDADGDGVADNYGYCMYSDLPCTFALDPLDPPVGATEGAWAGLAWTLQLGPVTPGS